MNNKGWGLIEWIIIIVLVVLIGVGIYRIF
jgi:hypothetical protein